MCIWGKPGGTPYVHCVFGGIGCVENRGCLAILGLTGAYGGQRRLFSVNIELLLKHVAFSLVFKRWVLP